MMMLLLLRLNRLGKLDVLPLNSLIQPKHKLNTKPILLKNYRSLHFNKNLESYKDMAKQGHK